LGKLRGRAHSFDDYDTWLTTAGFRHVRRRRAGRDRFDRRRRAVAERVLAKV
jgi:hypothetical protein